MGEVIHMKFGKSAGGNRHFTLAVEQDNEGLWGVSIKDFWDEGMSQATMCREIAQLLPVMVGGLHEIANTLDPNERGTMVGLITIYENGTIDMLMEPIDNRQKQTWMGVAVDKVRAYIDNVYHPTIGRA